MKFGLSDKIIEDIQQVFQDNWKVDNVLIFGSRAKGNYREGSDIDLAVKGRDITFEDILSLSSKLDDLNLPYEIDLINYSAIKDKDVVEHIARVGIVFYERWKKYKLKDAPLEIIDGDRSLNYPKHRELLEVGEIPFLNSTAIKDFQLDYGAVKFISKEKAEAIRKGKTEDGDIVLTTRGNGIGKLILYSDQAFKSAFINAQMLILRARKDEILPKFLYHLLKSKLMQSEFKNNASGSAQPQLPIFILKEIYLNIPPINEQRIIYTTLSSIDDKINLLQRQNKTLEQLAETLFRLWFVEEANDDWEEGTLEDEFDFIMGQSPEGVTLNEDGIGMVFYQGRSDFGFRFPGPRVYTTSPTRLAKKFDTLVSVRAPVGDMNMAIEECCLGRGVAAFRYKYNPSFYTYTYYKMRSLMRQIKQFEDNGSVFGSIGKDDFKKLENDIPSKDLIERYQKEVKPLDDKIYLNTTQVNALIKLRDSLLPKLMSGEVRVKMC